MTITDGLALVLLLAVNGFFVGAEFALISARHTQIEPQARAGSRRAQAVLAAMNTVPTMLAAAQLGVTLASLMLGAFGEPVVSRAVEPLFAAVGLPQEMVHPVAFALALLLVVSAHVIIGEMVPKNLALSGPDTAALWLVPPLFVLARAIGPLLTLIQAMAGAALRLLRIPPADEIHTVYTSAELPVLIEESRRHKLLRQDERDRMIATLALQARPVGTVMVPIGEVVSVPATIDSLGLQEYSGRHGHSRFPVHGDSPTELRGYLHILDALNGHGSRQPLPIRALPLISGTATLADVLATMRQRRAQLAAVTGDRGQVLGVVTLDDVLSGIVRQPSRGPS
ncbi:hemolysin family protein [Nonomuraea aurantiaca]|uniref:hemolysin family protein n=1 Tax=Nonomuraea aurantiaca TaxID=2878562 RepID=UPI001CDA330A|nr:hemolysin family protein [Nonomuraea aurantiaca]MCA2226625.1 hemolysin family protein [Nonomuraea aurantiaca]